MTVGIGTTDGVRFDVTLESRMLAPPAAPACEQDGFSPSREAPHLTAVTACEMLGRRAGGQRFGPSHRACYRIERDPSLTINERINR